MTDAIRTPPDGGDTMQIATRAMACEWSIVLNPGRHERVMEVGDILELIHETESWLSVYRPNSQLSRINQNAAHGPVVTRREVFEVLQLAASLHQLTDGGFDLTAGSLIQLWRNCRREKRIPTEEEVAETLLKVNMSAVCLTETAHTVEFTAPGISLDPGAIGKGYALDSAAKWLLKKGADFQEFLVHGGHSSLIARGRHNGHDGWPVGIGNPLLTKSRLATVLLKDQAMSTSGSNIQFFRHGGRRYGHILDPKTGWPAEGMLSVTVFASSAAVADALSTAFFVLGVEKAAQCCDNLQDTGVILIPFPQAGKRVSPTVIGVPPERIFWDEEQVAFS